MSVKDTTTANESASSEPVDTEMPTLSPSQMGWVTLTATVNVRMLPEPVKNHLAERAREIEREFQQEFGVPAETWPTHSATWPHERTQVGLEATVSVRDCSPKERCEAHERATQYEREFIQEVKDVREILTE